MTIYCTHCSVIENANSYIGTDSRSLVVTGAGGRWQEGNEWKGGARGNLRVRDIFIILIVVMVS